MFKVVVLALLTFVSADLLAWGSMSAKVDFVTVNTYGNYSEPSLNGGYCFKLAGYSDYLKIAYEESGEKKNNLQIVQSMVLTAYVSGKTLEARYVDWGEAPTCLVRGANQPAKWLEDLRMVD